MPIFSSKNRFFYGFFIKIVLKETIVYDKIILIKARAKLALHERRPLRYE